MEFFRIIGVSFNYNITSLQFSLNSQSLYQDSHGFVVIRFATKVLLLFFISCFGFTESGTSSVFADSNETTAGKHRSADSPAVPLATLNIRIDPHSLFDSEEGVIKNRGRTHRRWEKFVNLELKTSPNSSLQTDAGFRLHGSKNDRKTRSGRAVNLDELQYALFFREQYTSTLPLSRKWLDGGNHQIARLTIDNGDVFAKQMANVIASEAGLPTPASRLMEVEINDESIGTRMVHESVNRTQWIYREGTNQIDFFSNRDKEHDQGWQLYSEMVSWYTQLKKQLSMHSAAEYIDLESFTKGIAVRMICGSNDWEQWAVYRNPQKNNRWKWVTWGLDSCISDRWQTSSKGLAEQHWLQVVASLNPDTGKLDFNYRNLQTLLFVDLINGDPEYRSYFIQTMETLLDSLNAKQFDKQIRLSHGNQTYFDLNRFLRDRGHFIKQNLRITMAAIH